MKPRVKNDKAAISRVVVWGTCDTDKPRVRILCQGLSENGIEVITCRSDVWRGIQDKSRIGGALGWLRLSIRMLLAYPILILRYLFLPRHDWVLLLYPAIPDIFVIRIFAWLRQTPVAIDWFLSAYDTVVLDRQLISPKHFVASCIYAIEWLAARLPDRVFMDTRAHAERMERIFGLPQGRVGAVWVGAEIDRFQQLSNPNSKSGECSPAFTVLFYGQFIPLHGIPTIIEAARELREEQVQWILIGRGQEEARIKAMLAQTPLPRLKWIDWSEYGELNHWMQSADVCLGIFGSSSKAASVIPNKVFQIVAAQRPLITRESPAIRELLTSDGSCVQLIEPSNSHALSMAVRAAKEHSVRSQLRAPCHVSLRASISPVAIGRQCLTELSGGHR